MKQSSACEKTLEQLFDFLDEELSRENYTAFCFHIQSCSRCKALVESYKKTTSLCRSAVARSLPGDFEQRLLIFLRQEIHHH